MYNNLNIAFMKRVLLILCLLLSMNTATLTTAKMMDKKSPMVEVVNEQTVIFKNVIKIEIRSTSEDQITYVYDIKHGKMANIAKGSFEVELPYGDYLVQSNHRITKMEYQTIEF